MKLLLDEHYSPEIAKQLRERGHDVVAVVERPQLGGASDRDLLPAMAEERRAILTENVADFAPVARQSESDHCGLVFSSLPRSRDTIGLFVEALDAFLRKRPGEDVLVNQIAWL